MLLGQPPHSRERPIETAVSLARHARAVSFRLQSTAAGAGRRMQQANRGERQVCSAVDIKFYPWESVERFLSTRTRRATSMEWYGQVESSKGRAFVSYSISSNAQASI